MVDDDREGGHLGGQPGRQPDHPGIADDVEEKELLRALREIGLGE
jgi:hypothetical protein